MKYDAMAMTKIKRQVSVNKKSKPRNFTSFVNQFHKKIV
jgi:hypothetical protein